MLKAYNETIKDANGNSKTYSIKIGNRVPQRGANLAYVSSPSVSPSDSIVLTSYNTSDKEMYEEKTLMPDDDMRLVGYNKDELFPSDNVYVTDQFTVRNTTVEALIPLYNKTQLKFNIKLNAADLLKYESGYMTKPYSQLQYGDITKDDMFIFNPKSTRIKLYNADGTVATIKYKILIEKLNETEGKAFVFTENEISNITVTYLSVSGGKKEVINTYPYFFRDDDMDQYVQGQSSLKNYPDIINKLTDPIYALREEGSEYAVYVPTQNLVANESTRKLFNFRYRVEANRQVKYDISHKGTINIGVYCVGGNTSKDIGDAMASIQAKISKLPSFITFQNPHPPYASVISGSKKTTDIYWNIDLNMPPEHYHDYDVIIIGGTGEDSLSQYNDCFKDYLYNGGSLWIDNCGADGNAMILESNLNSAEGPFLVGVDFNTSLSENTQKVIVKNEMELLSRYGVIGDVAGEVANIGYKNTAPVMSLLSFEDPDNWKTLIKYDSTDRPALMYKRAFERGLVVVSNCGIMFGANEETTLGVDNELAINIMTVLGEDLWHTTPWTNDYVIHKDQLFDGEFGTDVGQYRLEDCAIASLTKDQVAVKKLELSAEAMLNRYHNLTTTVKSETYYFRVEEFDSTINSYAEKNIVNMDAKKIDITSKSNPLYVYTISSPGQAFDIDSLGYSDGHIQIFNQYINFSYLVRPFVYVWSDTAGAQKVKKVYGDAVNIGFNTSTNTGKLKIRKSDGLKMFDALAVAAPGTPEGDMWYDKDNVYYEVLLGNYIKSSNTPVHYLNKPITLVIKNTKTNEIYTDVNGYPCIPYGELFNEDNAGYIHVYASTTYQTIMATKRVYSVKALESAPIKTFLPDEIDDKDQWFLRISNGIHRVNLINKLHEPSLIYAINDFHDQLFLPNEPFKQVIDEAPKYLDYHILKTGKSPIYLEDLNIEDERLILVGSYTYKSKFFRNWNSDNTVTIKLVDPIAHTEDVISQENLLSIDYDNGAITVSDLIQVNDSKYLTASFKCSNFNAKKMSFVNKNINSEMLTIINTLADRTIYKTKDNIYNVKLYQKINGVKTSIPFEYSLDADLGLITVYGVMQSPLYADYKYFDMTNVKISDIDTQAGIIYTVDEIQMNDKIRVDYYYEEKNFNYKGYYDGDNFIKLDLNPSVGHTVTQVAYTKDAKGNTVKVTTNIPTTSIVDKPIYVYMIPSYDTTVYVAKVASGIIKFDDDGTAYVDHDANSGTIPAGAVMRGSSVYRNILENNKLVNKLVFVGSDLDLNNLQNVITNAALISKFNNPLAHNKILSVNERIMPLTLVKAATKTNPYDYITCCVYNKSNIMHTFNKAEYDSAAKNKNAILLAEVSVKQKVNVDDVVVMDGRVRGGGLSNKVDEDQIKKLYPSIYNELMNFWDIGTWDGTPYQKNGTTIITLPTSAKKYSEDKLKEIIDKYIAYGVQYIIEYKDI